MRYLEAGGARLSIIGLGTWQFGSREWGYGESYASGEADRIVRRALELGVNVIDTAEIYGFGRSEKIVGRAIAGRRDDVFLASKLFPVLPMPQLVERQGRHSAERLGVDRIDLYQAHWPNPAFPMRMVMAGMARLQRAGVIRHVGVSNFDLAQWQRAEAELQGTVLTNQVEYSLVARKPDRELVPWAQATGHVVIAYSPLGQGLLSGRFDGTNTPHDVRASNALFLPQNVAKAQPLLTALREIAAAHDATPAQVSLAWLIRRPNVIAIPGASSVAQLESNVAAADLQLTEDENQRLTAASDAFQPVTGIAAVPQLLRERVAHR